MSAGAAALQHQQVTAPRSRPQQQQQQQQQQRPPQRDTQQPVTMPLRSRSPVAAERRMDLASLFCLIGRHGPAVALAVIALVSVLAAFVIYRTVRGKRRKAGGDGTSPGAAGGAPQEPSPDERNRSAASTDVSDEDSSDADLIQSDLRQRHAAAAAAAAAAETKAALKNNRNTTQDTAGVQEPSNVAEMCADVTRQRQPNHSCSVSGTEVEDAAEGHSRQGDRVQEGRSQEGEEMMFEAENQNTEEEEENMLRSDSSNDGEDTEQDTRPPPLELDGVYELENGDGRLTDTEAEDRCGHVTDSGGGGADGGEEPKECASEEAGVPAGPEGGGRSGTTDHTSAHLSLTRTQTQEAAAEDTAPGGGVGVDPAAAPAGDAVCVPPVDRLSSSSPHPLMDQTDRGDNTSGVSSPADGVTTEDVDPPPDAVAPPSGDGAGEPLETDDVGADDRVNADDAQERDDSGERRQEDGGSDAAPAVAEDADADTRGGVNDGVGLHLQTTGGDADTLSDGASLSPSVPPDRQTEDTDRRGTSEEPRIPCAGDGEEAETQPTDAPADILTPFSVEQQTDPTTNDDDVSTATPSSPSHLPSSEQTQLSSSPGVESGIPSLAVDTTTAPRSDERSDDVPSVPRLGSSGYESLAANEDPLGREIEDGYQTAMAAFMDKYAPTKEEGKNAEKKKKKAAGAEEEEDEDFDKTEISIMEATMDQNEWITDANHQLLPWMNISAPAVTQDTTENHHGSSLAVAPPSADDDAVGDQKAEAVRPPGVDVTFRVHYLTHSPYQSVAVTGNRQELGNWKGYVPLERAGAGHWAAAVGLPADSHVEWKFVVVDRGQVCRWEECGNRLLDTGRGDELLVHKWWGFL